MPKLSNLQKCVIVIMLSFAAYIAYSMSGHASAKSLATKSLMNEHGLGRACRQYASDHQGAFPPTLDTLFPNYLSDRATLASPLNPSEPIGYTYTSGLKDMGPVNAVLIEDKFAPAQHLRIVTYVDGSSRILNTP